MLDGTECNAKTVAVLGGSYGGYRAAQILIANLPSGWRVVLVDRNSHFNHVYNLPRYSVLPGHEHKAFIPYDNLFANTSDPLASESHRHEHVHGTITSIHPHHITYRRHAKSSPAAKSPLEPSLAPPTQEEMLYFDYAILALGSHLPSPIDLWGSRNGNFGPVSPEPERGLRQTNPNVPYTGTKQESISWLRSRQRDVEAARQVLVVGGGALGIQFASDIAAVYPRKSVTLLHSRSRLLPKFDDALGDEARQSLEELGVHVILCERLDMSTLDGTTTLVKTTKGCKIEADLVLLCTGQVPNTSLLRTMDPRTVKPESGMVRVSRTMQIQVEKEWNIAFYERGASNDYRSVSPTLCGTIPPSPVDMPLELDLAPPAAKFSRSSTNDFAESDADTLYDPSTFVYPHLFAIGDAADAFGAIKAGHTAYYQGEVAARNVIKLIKGTSETKGDDSEDLELEEYVPGAPMIKVSLGLTKSAYEVAGVVDTKDDGTDDLGAISIWGLLGYNDIGEEDMWT